MKVIDEEPKPPVPITPVKARDTFTRYDRAVRLCEINPAIAYLIKKLECDIPV